MKVDAATIACCPPVLEGELTTSGAEGLADALKVLADPARLRLLNLIDAAGEACACNLTEPLGLTQPTVSHHLKVLREAGFLRREQRGKWAYFSVDPDRLQQVAAAIGPS